MIRVGVIGAGVAGLSAARLLTAAGLSVTVFDKGRRGGGRANTREHDDRRFDHGAQFFTIRDPAHHEMLASWIEGDVVAEWHGRIIHSTADETTLATPTRRYVGTPEMISLPEHLSEGLDVRVGIRVDGVGRDTGGRHTLELPADDGKHAFDWLVVATPAPQAVPLLSASARLAGLAAEKELLPCWAAMLNFDTPLSCDFDGAFMKDSALSWISRDSAKPGRARPRGEESWVLHAGPEWSQAHLELAREEVPSLLFNAMQERFGELPKPIFERAHLWRYALATEAFEGNCLVDHPAGIAVCGDWCAGGRVEGALLSGRAAAREILESL